MDRGAAQEIVKIPCRLAVQREKLRKKYTMHKKQALSFGAF